MLTPEHQAGPVRITGLLLAAALAGCVCCNAPGKRTHDVARAEAGKPSGNSGVVEIPDLSGYSQVVVVSDIHGMADNLKRLLLACKITATRGHWAAGNSLVVVVGDCIDKGPRSLAVLDLWMRLSQEATTSGGRVIVLLGNHEAEFLADPNNNKAAALRDELKESGLDTDELTDTSRPRGRFLRAMPLAARLGGHWLFCHAGWVPRMPWNDFVKKANTVLAAGDYGNDFLAAEDSILEKRNADGGGKWWESEDEVRELEARLTADGIYGVVFGHQPEAFGLTGQIGPYSPRDYRLIKIDTGMSPDAGSHPGRMLVFPAPKELMSHRKPEHILSEGFDSKHEHNFRTDSL